MKTIIKAKLHLDKIDYIIICGLLMLSALPIIAGLIKVQQLATGVVTPENSRFHLSPFPVVIHIIVVTIYSILGAFQFSPSIRKQFINLHRKNGKLLLVSGIVVALTGLWMTLTYPFAHFDGVFLYYVRLAVGFGMLYFIGMGIRSIRLRDFTEHGKWMIRAYALGLGAGTQALTHIPWFAFPSIQGEFARAVCMTAGWVINLVVAEWIIRTNWRMETQI